MNGHAATAWLFLGALSVAPSTAHAYGELSRFDNASADGGGGGRWFTGSPVDGYTCDVCHIDPTALDVQVTALPDRYTPGATYEVHVGWPEAPPHVQALLELTDERGNTAGTLAVPDRSTLADAELCRPRELMIGAANVIDASQFPTLGPRRLMGFTDCGATQFRFLWTAPAGDVGPIFFSGGVIAANERPTFDQRDVYDDGFAQLFEPLLPPSLPAYDVETRGGCAITTATYGPPPWSYSALWALALSIRFRRR